jgi:hypothetical protein
VWRRFIALNDRFAEKAGEILSWSVWFPIIVFGTTGWLVYHQLTHGRFDDGLVILVLILTIQTSIDSISSKLFQQSLRRSDAKRDEQWMHQLASMAELTIAIKTELDNSAERDEATRIRDDQSAIRDLTIFETTQRLVNVLEYLEESMDPDKWAALLARIQALPTGKKKPSK